MKPLVVDPAVPAADRNAAGEPTLRRNSLSGFENVAQTLGTMAPTGCLGVIIPLVIGKTGNGAWLLMLGVVLTYLLIFFNINIFATRCASSGGLGTFASLGLGPWAGTLTKWIYVVAMVFGAAGSAPSSAFYACLLITQFTGLATTPLLAAAVTTAIVLASWWTAHRDMKLSSNVMIAIEISSLTMMFAIIAVAMAKGGPWVDHAQLTLAGAGPRAFGAGVVISFIMMGGFESATTLGEEAQDAKKTIPRAILQCLLPLGLLYVVMTYLICGLGRQLGFNVDQLDAPFDTLARAYHLSWLGTLSSVGVALSYFACTLGSINAGSRALYSLAEDRLFFRRVGLAHPRNATPHRAIAILGVITVLAPAVLLLRGVSLLDTLDDLSEIGALGFIASYFMVCVAAPCFLARSRSLDARTVLGAAVTLGLLAVVLVQSVYPVPPAPACYLPYAFLACVALGLGSSWCFRRRAPSA